MSVRARGLVGAAVLIAAGVGAAASCGSDSSTAGPDDGGGDATTDSPPSDAPRGEGGGGGEIGADAPGDAAVNDASSEGGDASSADGANDGAPETGDGATDAGDDGAGDTGADAASDGVAGDGASDGGPQPVLCPSQPCSNAQSCCAVGTDAGPVLECLATCPNGEGPIDCTSPLNCGGGTPFCCITATVGAGNLPNCKFESASASCTAQCVTALQPMCNATDIARACDQPSDCDPAHANCCALPLGMYSPYVCVDNLTKQFLGLTCM
jgi:hypothetical protein